MRSSILIVDNEEIICRGLSRVLSDNYMTYQALSGREAIEIIRKKSGIDVVLCDLTMPEMDGTELIGRIRSENKDITIIVITASSPQRVCDAMKKGANYFFIKPLDISELEMALKCSVENRTQRSCL